MKHTEKMSEDALLLGLLRPEEAVGSETVMRVRVVVAAAVAQKNHHLPLRRSRAAAERPLRLVLSFEGCPEN
jgi:hypothetical protein